MKYGLGKIRKMPASINIYNESIRYSSPHELMEALNKDAIANLVVEGKSYTIPFCSAYVISFEHEIQFMLENENYFKSFLSPRFSKLCKPFVQEVCKDMISGIERILDEYPSYAPIADEILEIRAPFQYEIVMQILKPRKEDTLLEVGCSTGNLSILLASQVKEVLGIDKNKHVIHIAKKKARTRKLENCNFRMAKYPFDVNRNFECLVAFQLETNLFFDSFPANRALVTGTLVKGDKEAEKKFLSKISKKDDYKITEYETDHFANKNLYEKSVLVEKI